MTRTEIQIRLTNAFECLLGTTKVEFIFQDELIYIYTDKPFKQFRIELPSDDDGFFYAYVWNGTDYEPTCCIRIAYP